MNLRTACVAGAVFAIVVGCKKKDDTVAGAAPKASTTTAGNDPWGDPASAVNKLGAATGDELAKIDTSKDPAPASALAAKVDIGGIAAPSGPKLAIKGFANVSTNGFSVTYNPSTNAVHEQFRSALQNNHVFEQVAEGLNKTVRIPQAVAIEMVDCNTINAFYDPNTKRIIVCYELLDYFLDVFKPVAKSENELGNAVIGATMFSFYHEAGHGFINLLDLPAVGREEDSVDQLATLTLIAMGDEGVGMALSGAYWFQLQSTKGGHDTPFWDEHAFDGQRFYNIMCLIYGSNPDKYAAFLTNGALPQDRAKRCPEEYTKINHAWQKLLEPYLTNGAATNVAYTPTVPVAEAPKTTADDPWGDSSGTGAAPATPAAPAAPADPGITCEQVATRAAELIGAEAEDRAKSMTAAEIDELKARLEAELPAAMQQILSECAKASWSQAARKCVIDAPTLAKASACGS
jgi:hypothetical protein